MHIAPACPVRRPAPRLLRCQRAPCGARLPRRCVVEAQLFVAAPPRLIPRFRSPGIGFRDCCRVRAGGLSRGYLCQRTGPQVRRPPWWVREAVRISLQGRYAFGCLCGDHFDCVFFSPCSVRWVCLCFAGLRLFARDGFGRLGGGGCVCVWKRQSEALQRRLIDLGWGA